MGAAGCTTEPSTQGTTGPAPRAAGQSAVAASGQARVDSSAPGPSPDGSTAPSTAAANDDPAAGQAPDSGGGNDTGADGSSPAAAEPDNGLPADNPGDAAAQQGPALAQGDAGEIGSLTAFSMPALVGLTVARSREQLGDVEPEFTDSGGSPTGAGDQQQVCQQAPDAGVEVVDQPVVLVIADEC